MKKNILKWVLILFFIFQIESLAYAASEATIDFSKGMVAFSDGDYSKALSFFQNAYKGDIKNPDYLYLLGLTHLKLENFSKASKHFKNLLEKNPDYSRAYFDYALSLYRQKNYQDGLSWFEKAFAADPKNPLPLFYQGLSNVALGETAQAIETFQKVETKFPKTDVAKNAKDWIAKIESKKAPSPPGKEGKVSKWGLRSAASFFYDSNVTLDPDDEDLAGFQRNQEDIMGSGALDLQYLLFQTKDTKLFVNYSGYQSAYANWNFDLNRFNYGRHISGVDLRFRFGKKIQLRVPINLTLITLGAAKYSISGFGESIVDVAWSDSWVTSFKGKITHDNYYASPTNLSQVRDATRPSVGFEQFYFLPRNKKIYFRGGYEADFNFAEGSDWDYYTHRFTFAFHTPLLWKMEFLTVGNFVPLRKFKRTDSIFNVRRGDATVNTTAVLSREIIPHLTGSISYTYSISDTNINRFTYKRHLAGFTLSAKL